mgnify:FL=1
MCTLKIEFPEGRFSQKIKFYVVNIEGTFILGRDQLAGNKCLIDFESSSLKFSTHK